MIIATHYNSEYDFAEVLNDNGVLIRSHTWHEAPYSADFNAMVVASNGDIYIAGKWEHKILRMDNNFNELVEVDAPYVLNLAIDPDGYIWSSEIDDGTNNQIYKKRDPLTLAILDTCDGLGAVSASQGMIFDADGFLYVIDWVSDEIEKWNVVTKTRVANRALAGGAELFPIMSQLAIRGSTLYLAQWASHESGDYWTCPTSLLEDFAPHELAEFAWDLEDPDPSAGYWVTYIWPLSTTGWIVMGVISRDVYVFRYDNDFNAVWNYKISGVSPQDYAWALSLGWVDLAVVGDYPLAPVMFPAHARGSTLKQKCRHFEESMSDVCLVFNHNVNVTRRYLQETYGDTTYPEDSNLRYVLPSQQLVKLLKDGANYKEIINNFITNISSMFTLINDNNTLVKTWLDDYEPDEAGHEFTDVKMKPIIIGDDLSKAMDDLFEGIEDNITILNANLEVLKERF